MTIASDRDLIAFHEGCTLVAKPDDKVKGTAWVIGYGRDIPAPPDPSNPPTCTQDQAEAWLDADLMTARVRASADIGPAWNNIDAVRRAVIVDMAYEIGGAGLAGFRNFIMAVRGSLWNTAAAELVDSKLYVEVPNREKMNVAMLLSGQWPVIA